MIRRSLRALSNLIIALGVLAMGVVALEWYLLDQEHVARCGSTEPYGDSNVFLPSASVHHTLRPGAEWKAEDPRNTFAINSFGLRGPEPAVPKPAGIYRVLLLGDEAIFSPSLAQNSTTASQLHTLFADSAGATVEVINGGVPGYCPLLSLLQYRSSLNALQPDLVVLNYSSDDIDDDYRYRGFLKTDEELRTSLACPHPVLTGRCVVGEATHSVTRFAIGRWFVKQVLDTPAADGSPSGGDIRSNERFVRLRHSLQPLQELAALSKQFASRLVVTCSPTEAEIVDGKPTRTWLALNRSVREFSVRHGIEFCDATTDYETRPNALLVDANQRASSETKPVLAVRLASYLSQNPRGTRTIRTVSGSSDAGPTVLE